MPIIEARCKKCRRQTNHNVDEFGVYCEVCETQLGLVEEKPDKYILLSSTQLREDEDERED